MGTARKDYEQFIRWIQDPAQEAPGDARSMATLVLNHFEEVAGTARQHNKRSVKLAELARKQLSSTPDNLPDLSSETLADDWPWVRLQKITLGPFRGFRRIQEFSLDKRITLCYGPNGSGKSSFCEALEYSLLGFVEEAQSKRLDERHYLANLHEGRFEKPELTAIDHEENEVKITPNPELYRFCFIEKNRINAFSRIAARPPGQRAELIATLFGMEQFNAFVKNFNESMDPVLTLDHEKQNELDSSRKVLEADRQIIEHETERLRELDTAATRYAEEFKKGITYDELKALVGSEDKPARLHELEEKVGRTPAPLTGLDSERTVTLYSNADAALDALRDSRRELDEYKSQITFRNLYTAIIELRKLDSTYCPACKTPVEKVSENPFSNAEKGLRDLEKLAQLEEEHQVREEALKEASRHLKEELDSIIRFLSERNESDGIVGTYISNLGTVQGATGWWKLVYASERPKSGETPTLGEILKVCDRASELDSQSRAEEASRQAYIEELAQLNKARLWITTEQERRSSITEESDRARTRIQRWEEENKDLIKSAQEEAEKIEGERSIKRAYDSFYELLNRFRNALPRMLMENLNHLTLELYNEFNYDDREEDKLAELCLPLSGEDRIEISFCGQAERFVDALTVLSEGHIRCLGLAILLAKAIRIGSPLIIFDDAINAIDHDHRGGIRASIFESERFPGTQLIVTCHSPEFIKDIENHIPKPARSEVRSFVLQHHRGDYQPRVLTDVPSSNYLARANEALERYDPREALGFARKTLEMLTNKTWKWLVSHRVGDIAVKVEGPGKEPQLRTLCESLRKKLANTPTFEHPSKQPLLDGLNTILGIPEQNLIWVLLNKGTHEEQDRDDFDVGHVQTIITVLESIDRLELRRGR